MSVTDMNKQDIVAAITRHLVENLPDIDPASIDPERSMRDYGANSLDMIEVVSSTMRELKIKIPRSELADVTNISQLADKFLEHMSKD